MRFGISILQTGDTAADAAKLALAVESAGFDLIGIPDSHSVWRELYVSAGAVAGVTSRCLVGPMVTNPLTRHPTVTASAIATLNEISSGRAFLGIGTGNSATLNLGIPPAGLDELERAVATIRSCFTARAADGLTTPMNWAGSVEIPIFVSASGPRAIAAAARCGDAVILEIGRDPAIVAKAVALAQAAHRASDRAERPLELWLLGKGYVAEDPDEAREALATIIAASANGLQNAMDWKEVPAEHRTSVRALHKGYAFSQHASTRSARTQNVDLFENLGLTDFLYDRFAIMGTAQEVAREIEALGALGIDGISFTGAVKDKHVLIDRLSNDVFTLIRKQAVG